MTGDVSIRRASLDELPGIVAVLQMPGLTEALAGGAPVLAMAHALCRGVNVDAWIISTEGRPIGLITLTVDTPGVLAYGLAPGYRGLGIMKLVLSALLADRGIGPRRPLVAFADSANTASLRVLGSLGFVADAKPHFGLIALHLS